MRAPPSMPSGPRNMPASAPVKASLRSVAPRAPTALVSGLRAYWLNIGVSIVAASAPMPALPRRLFVKDIPPAPPRPVIPPLRSAEFVSNSPVVGSNSRVVTREGRVVTSKRRVRAGECDLFGTLSTDHIPIAPEHRHECPVGLQQ